VGGAAIRALARLVARITDSVSSSGGVLALLALLARLEGGGAGGLGGGRVRSAVGLKVASRAELVAARADREGAVEFFAGGGKQRRLLGARELLLSPLAIVVV
jgi:hypothetical protein